MIVWDVEPRRGRETLTGHTGAGHRTGDQPRRPHALQRGADGKVLIWDLAGDRRLGRPFDTGPDDRTRRRPDSPGPELRLSPDGRLLAVGNATGP